MECVCHLNNAPEQRPKFMAIQNQIGVVNKMIEITQHVICLYLEKHEFHRVQISKELWIYVYVRDRVY